MEQKERIIIQIDVTKNPVTVSFWPSPLQPKNMASQPENLSPRRFANARILFWSHPVLNFIPSARMP